jgi:hypothetical protein
MVHASVSLLEGRMEMQHDKSGKSPRVLLVDDEQDILELLEMTLLKMGLRVDKASNVREALAKLAERRYDLCLTDMRMPDGEGPAQSGCAGGSYHRAWQYGERHPCAQGRRLRLFSQAGRARSVAQSGQGCIESAPDSIG